MINNLSSDFWCLYSHALCCVLSQLFCIFIEYNIYFSYDHEVAESFIIKMNQRTQKLMNNLTVAAQNVYVLSYSIVYVSCKCR